MSKGVYDNFFSFGLQECSEFRGDSHGLFQLRVTEDIRRVGKRLDRRKLIPRTSSKGNRDGVLKHYRSRNMLFLYRRLMAF